LQEVAPEEESVFVTLPAAQILQEDAPDEE